MARVAVAFADGAVCEALRRRARAAVRRAALNLVRQPFGVDVRDGACERDAAGATVAAEAGRKVGEMRAAECRRKFCVVDGRLRCKRAELFASEASTLQKVQYSLAFLRSVDFYDTCARGCERYLRPRDACGSG